MDDHAEDPIQKAMERGDFDNLPGMGKPLRLEHDRLVPDSHRLAYRIMRDNDVQPEWIALQQEINVRLEKAFKKLRSEARVYLSVISNTQDKMDLQSVTQRLDARARRDEAQNRFREEMVIVNQKILLYNLKVPGSNLTRNLIEVEEEIKKYFTT